MRPPDELTRLLTAAKTVLGERVAWALLLIYLLGVQRAEAAGFSGSTVR